jgi:prephenate dehydrogenase
MNIGIIGMGLIGGSLGRCIIKRTNHTVFGFDIDEKSMQKALLLNGCHQVLEDSDLNRLDMLIIALYPRAVKAYIDKYQDKLKSGCVIMDCGGIKRDVVRMMRKMSEKYEHLRFIGVHPMAGREYSGIEHSSVNLFEKASVLLCPVNPEIDLLTTIKHFFQEIGFGELLITTPEKHDRIIAYTSQLAHVMSNAYVKSPTAFEHKGFSAGSFRDLTRVARLNPVMWSELMMDNRDNLIQEIELLINNISKYKEALEKSDEEGLRLLLEEGSELKIGIDSTKT